MEYTKDSTRAFISEIYKSPLLKREQEIELGRDIQSAEKIIELCKTFGSKQLVCDDLRITETELEQILCKGKLSKDKLVRSNMRLVLSIAREHTNKGLPLLDLIQEGFIGLNRAAEKFNPEKGYKFSTYSYNWILISVLRASDNARMIRLPVHIVERLNKVKRVQRKFKEETGREPTQLEISEASRISPDKLSKLLKVQTSTSSLNRKLKHDTETEIIDLIESPGITPAEKVEQEIMGLAIKKLVYEKLTKPQIAVIDLRFGFSGEQPYSLAKIADTLGYSKEYVRKTEIAALRKLRLCRELRSLIS